LRDPFLFFQGLREERSHGADSRSPWYALGFLTVFSLVPAMLFPLWKPLSDWAASISVVKVLDFHFGNQVYLALSRDFYPLYYSYLGDPVLAWLVCIPTLLLDTLGTALFFAAFLHLLARYLLGGRGTWRDGLACVVFGDLPSLLFGFLPFSAAVGLTWTTLLQFTVSVHYLYQVPWNRALIPYVAFALLLLLAWSLYGTASPPGLLDAIPRGPYKP